MLCSNDDGAIDPEDAFQGETLLGRLDRRRSLGEAYVGGSEEGAIPMLQKMLSTTAHPLGILERETPKCSRRRTLTRGNLGLAMLVMLPKRGTVGDYFRVVYDNEPGCPQRGAYMMRDS